jgi:hypothetical protein
VTELGRRPRLHDGPFYTFWVIVFSIGVSFACVERLMLFHPRRVCESLGGRGVNWFESCYGFRPVFHKLTGQFSSS